MQKQLEDIKRNTRITTRERDSNACDFASDTPPADDVAPRLVRDAPRGARSRDAVELGNNNETTDSLLDQMTDLTLETLNIIREDEEHLPLEIVRARKSIDGLLASVDPEVRQHLDIRSEDRQLQEQDRLEASGLWNSQEQESDRPQAIIVEIDSDDDSSVFLPDSPDTPDTAFSDTLLDVETFESSTTSSSSALAFSTSDATDQT